MQNTYGILFNSFSLFLKFVKRKENRQNTKNKIENASFYEFLLDIEMSIVHLQSNFYSACYTNSITAKYCITHSGHFDFFE